MASAAALRANLIELDSMLHDLSNVQSRATRNNGPIGDKVGAKGPKNDLHQAPLRPPPPKSYSPPLMTTTTSTTLTSSAKRGPSSAGSYCSNGTAATNASTLMRRPRHPPKLQHILKDRRHDLVKAGPREEGVVAVVPAPSDMGHFDSEDYGGEYTDDDYYHDSNYSLGEGHNSANGTIAHSVIPEVPEEALEEVDAGEAPRGDKSMIIKTDLGELKSKYHYLGFGLWQNTEPAARPPPPSKPCPPPPPPKAEPIWYNCTVSVETHKTSKELDDLVHGLSGYDRLPDRGLEAADGGGGLEVLGDIYEPFEKEDLSEMFRRAFLEQMGGVDETDRGPGHKCYVCRKAIGGRVITAMSHKFHPECFVCTYCRKEFTDRSFKSDAELRPYCHGCFEKLLGHFGNAHFRRV